ncbi:VanZ family protein [Halopseudomonas sp.]|uniref:VanZ family protein n=1 Tax=Halopseudomonas sp. TaxID=2901191 RepID=UPI0035696820
MRQWARYRLVFKVMFFVVLGFGIYLGMTPTPPTALPGWNAYFYHAGGLFVCTILNFLAFPRWYRWVRGLLMFMVGVAVEYVQSFHPTRSTDITDIYANTAGVLLGLVLIWVFEVWRKSRQPGRSTRLLERPPTP